MRRCKPNFNAIWEIDWGVLCKINSAACARCTNVTDTYTQTDKQKTDRCRTETLIAIGEIAC